MGQEVGITEEYARYVLKEFDDAINDIKGYLQEHQDLGQLASLGDACGSLPDGQKRKEILKKSGQTFLQWGQDQVDYLQGMRDLREKVFNTYWGTDWSSKQDLSKVQIPDVQPRGH
ncbi:hypothetical protein [Segniliparus rugosus]|uniref:Uncharacterized protein n=1 Tax=Segniliparus rugosus (strain ATCC BAA-974 / DSM 45345 / CCUG 50838 / CIP 108380 / JCM 13579 / CDC 945) TaxID=679197 RepID=E5XT47_SEGRC|nr:hypothetical protein [Segniliparus rugosus]EFV12458.1 hypothetical protein HMPREF9336_02669 [Segniliparus rugosus ATCC BAA-974]